MVATNSEMLDSERYSVTFVFVADRREAEGNVVAGSDATDARFVPWEECAELDTWDDSDPLLEAVREASAAGYLDQRSGCVGASNPPRTSGLAMCRRAQGGTSYQPTSSSLSTSTVTFPGAVVPHRRQR